MNLILDIIKDLIKTPVGIIQIVVVAAAALLALIALVLAITAPSRRRKKRSKDNDEKRLSAKSYEKLRNEKLREAEIKALDELEQAKKDYYSAIENRIQAEKNKEIALENLREEEREKRNLEKLKAEQKNNYTPPVMTQTESSDYEDEELPEIPEDNETYTQITFVEGEPEMTEATFYGEDEQSYDEEVVVTDATYISRNYVYDLVESAEENAGENDDDWDIAVTEDDKTNSNSGVNDMKNNKENLQKETAEVDEVEVIEFARQKKPEKPEEKKQVEKPANRRRERPKYYHVKEQTFDDEEKKEKPTKAAEPVEPVKETKTATVKVVKKAAANDLYAGIPATPIHKKNKFQKPVTKIIKKNPDAAKTTPVTKAEPAKAEKPAKWRVSQSETGYKATLVAPTGEKLVTTAEYSGMSGLKSAINAIKNNLASDKAEIVPLGDKFTIKLATASGKNMLSGEEYSSKYQCEKAIFGAKKYAENSVIV